MIAKMNADAVILFIIKTTLISAGLFIISILIPYNVGNDAQEMGALAPLFLVAVDCFVGCILWKSQKRLGDKSYL